ncbi:Nn.00g059510.m01.CDS01 [Neocucurbitaria sp. VM-36]
MAEPMSTLSPEKLNASSNSMLIEDDFDMTFHDPPSSPFVSHIENDDQENIAPNVAPTPSKPLLDFGDDVPQSAFKVSPEKKFGMKERASPMKNLMDDFEEAALKSSVGSQRSPKKTSPVKQIAMERPESAMSSRSHKRQSLSKSPRAPSVESTQRKSPFEDKNPEILPTPSKRPSSSHKEPALRDNEGLTVAMRYMEETRTESQESLSRQTSQANDSEMDLEIDNTDFNPDGPEITSADMDDTCFSTFSEMPGLDMTKFAFLKQSPAKGGPQETTPRARPHMTPSTVRRTERTPSPTPRRAYKENDTTNLLLDFTAQIESFSSSRRTSPARGRTSPTKSSTQPDLRSYYQNQRSPAKGGSYVPATPSQSRQMLNLLDFELPPPPTPRSLPTVTIREMESVKSQFQSQISSLSASLSGKEAEVESLAKAVADAERRVGEAHETVRDERSAREYAEAQMTDWKKKGEEVQKLLQDVQSELARNDSEREQLLSRLAEAEKRAEDADNRSSELETKIIEAESKNVDMTTFINNDEEENKKIYSEMECQAAIAEKVNEVARDLHSAYKAKHEKKIKALKDNYQKKADERCKELRLQIIRLERQVEEAEKKRDNTFSKIMPGDVESRTEETCEKCGKDAKGSSSASSSNAEDIQRLEAQRAEIESLKAKLAGLQSELQSLRTSHDTLVEDLEAERIEKGELVAAAEQMLAMCGEKMEEMQQEDLRRSQIGSAPPSSSASAPTQRAPPENQALRNTGFLAGGGPTTSSSRPGSALGGGRPGSAMGDRLGAMNDRPGAGAGASVKPSGLRAPGGFGFQGGAPGLSRSTSGGKSRLLSNIERMGGGRTQE